MMKSLQIAFGILFSLILFTSCNKDKDSKTNEIRIADTTIQLAGGALINYGEFPYFYDGYEFDLVLHGENFAVTEMDGDIDLEGTGFEVYFEIYSDSANFLADGIYTYEDTESYPTKTFGYCSYKLSYDADYPMYINSGTIEVKRGRNDTYEIVFELVDDEDNTISGYYKGPLLYFTGQHYY